MTMDSLAKDGKWVCKRDKPYLVLSPNVMESPSIIKYEGAVFFTPLTEKEAYGWTSSLLQSDKGETESMKTTLNDK